MLDLDTAFDVGDIALKSPLTTPSQFSYQSISKSFPCDIQLRCVRQKQVLRSLSLQGWTWNWGCTGQITLPFKFRWVILKSTGQNGTHKYGNKGVSYPKNVWLNWCQPILLSTLHQQRSLGPVFAWCGSIGDFLLKTLCTLPDYFVNS